MVFEHDGSEAAPSFNLYIYKGFYKTGPIVSNITFSVYPELINNNLILIEGETVTFSAAELQATDASTPADDLQFIISDLSHGQFVSTSNDNQTILQFPQVDVTQSKIQFIHDGSNEAPSYQISVSNGILQTKPDSALINFTPTNDLPQLITNNFVIRPQGTTTISAANIQASDEETSAANLQFIVSDVIHGHFEKSVNPGVHIKKFIQEEVNNAGIKFLVDRSGILPEFNVTVSDGQLQTKPVSAIVQFDQNSLAHELANNTTRNVLIGTFASVGFIGVLLLAYMAIGHLTKHRLRSVINNCDEDEKLFYKEIVVPVARAIFKQIKITGFMNYISTNQIEAYVSEIATIVSELKSFGISVQLQELDPEEKTQLLHQIIKQMKKHLRIESNRGSHFFKPQVMPEQIREHASTIAQAVSVALKQNATEEIYLPTNLYLDSIKLDTHDGSDTPYWRLE